MSFFKEPFLHFALLGAAIFAWFLIENPPSEAAPAENEIIVSRQIMQTLSGQFEAKMNRAPTAEEARSIMERFIRNEAMVREARALGLDQGDGVVRNRLAQKMRFLTTSAAQSAVPEDAELEKHLTEYADRFESGARISFRQVTLAEGVDETGVQAMLVQLQNGEEPDQARILRLLPDRIDNATQQQVDGAFGRGVFENIASLPADKWAGPVPSGYGFHLVRVTELVPATLPPLDTVRDAVLQDWRTTLGEQLTEAHLEALMESYTITRPSDEDLAAWISR